MNKIFKLVSLVILSLLLACASAGKKFDANKTNQIKVCETKETEILEWFGEPYNRGSVNGLSTLNYSYTSASMVGSSESQNLTVYMNQNKTVVNYVLNPTVVLLDIEDKCLAKTKKKN